LAISYRLNYLDRHYQYTPALTAYQLDAADLFIAQEKARLGGRAESLGSGRPSSSAETGFRLPFQVTERIIGLWHGSLPIGTVIFSGNFSRAYRIDLRVRDVRRIRIKTQLVFG
jgi:hypothetical protein